MIQTMDNDNDFNELGHREKKFVLHTVAHPEDSAAEAARQAGVSDVSARSRAVEMSAKPEVQQAIARLREKVGDTTNIDIKQLVNDGLMSIATGESADRDRLQAMQLLGKTQKMFVDVTESTDKTLTDEQLLAQIEKTYGREARDRAAEDIGAE